MADSSTSVMAATASTSNTSISSLDRDSSTNTTQPDHHQEVPRLVNNTLESPSSSSSSSSKSGNNNNTSEKSIHGSSSSGSSSSSRTSKRANSTVSMSERNKIRSKLDMLPYDHTNVKSLPSVFNSPERQHSQNEYSLEDDSHSSKLDARHYSASSITHAMNTNKTVISPLAPSLDYFWSNKSLHKLYPIKLISNEQLKSIMNWHYSNPLPECESIFPWLHGIHHSNQNQRDFLNSLINFTTVEKNNFDVFNQNNGKIPSTNRSLMPIRSNFIDNENEQIVKSSAVLKGSVTSNEILCQLDVSRQDLLILLNGLLKDLKIHDSNGDEFEQVLNTLFKDCETLGLLPIFKNMDPVKGISLRNFHIQVCKLAQISDFIVYCFNDSHLDNDHHEVSKCHCASVARLLYFAQLKHAIDYPELIESMFTTLILQDNDLSFFKKSEANRRLLAIDKIDRDDTIKPPGKICSVFDYEVFDNWDTNYLFREKLEISRMSTATPVINNVWFGNCTDYEVLKIKGSTTSTSTFNSNSQNFESRNINPEVPLYVDPTFTTVGVTRDILSQENDNALITPAAADWGLFINCCEGSNFPSLKLLDVLLRKTHSEISSSPSLNEKTYLNFPPSGSIGLGDLDDDDLISLLNVCKLLYVNSTKENPSLIYCSDGYTESSLLAVCYTIYATGNHMTEVVADLHNKYGRPFFLFPTDVQLINRIEEILITYSPVKTTETFIPNKLDLLENQFIYEQLFTNKEQTWFTKLGGSMPSRILPHLYLGSLHHASSPQLLHELGITRVVSVGEKLNWGEESSLQRTIINNNISIINGITGTPITKVMCITNIQDDGIDTLTHNLRDILDFIDDAYKDGAKVLVHCRVGVSRSATVCIAEVMRRLKINLIRAYIFVRVRRLNVIIQPNLRFMYELVKWEENERLEHVKKKLLDLKSSNSNSPITDNLQKVPVSSIELSKRLSGSISSLSSAISESTGETSTVPFLENSESPIRLASNALDQVIEDETDEDDDNDVGNIEESDELENNYWLRDVDWHILCREIDYLNRAYIGGR
ncbi:Dual specificity protein phosphatase [Wickerhamomyces ciferrii]|uniref:Dual specificity protein phosphatase n=1 Tax=Wickerhamomyces ciferrii (strain ATCC 14091 / BCRC 22168 / CBS 111 / JCM 3599 / NBRC 0793 / NRRL Y-1031 F-60-10) TaxID=1206466 RepID=K0KDI3_WICCF|nr:Dual specificity protein phosphatase [Wickerhamomyces ciferrii]CCH40986.1 Dual specificity protein phosphatase [Wickerhamomyces ciferrii]